MDMESNAFNGDQRGLPPGLSWRSSDGAWSSQRLQKLLESDVSQIVAAADRDGLTTELLAFAQRVTQATLATSSSEPAPSALGTITDPNNELNKAGGERKRQRKAEGGGISWTSEEETRLCNVIDESFGGKPKGRDWNDIAALLGTRRTGDAVKQHYHRYNLSDRIGGQATRTMPYSAAPAFPSAMAMAFPSAMAAAPAAAYAMAPPATAPRPTLPPTPPVPTFAGLGDEPKCNSREAAAAEGLFALIGAVSAPAVAEAEEAEAVPVAATPASTAVVEELD